MKIMLSHAIIRITTMGWTIPGNFPCRFHGQLIYPLRTTGHKITNSCGLDSSGYMTEWMTEQIKTVKKGL
jgi:hypothetical protein